MPQRRPVKGNCCFAGQMQGLPRWGSEPMGTVLQVGNGGRGFVIEVDQMRYVITAAHCLTAPCSATTESTEWPQLPPPHGLQILGT